MGTLFGEDFERRVDLQRRQLYHQERAEAARFRPNTDPEVAAEVRDPNTAGVGISPNGFFGPALGIVAVLFFVVTIPAAILSAALALPVGWQLMSWGRALTGHSIDSYGGFYRSALCGVFGYLIVTALTASIYAVVHAPHTRAGIGSDFSAVLSPHALGFQRGLLMLIPGLFVCAAIWSLQMGAPFNGWKGYLRAMTLATMSIPTSMAALSYLLIRVLS